MHAKFKFHPKISRGTFETTEKNKKNRFYWTMAVCRAAL